MSGAAAIVVALILTGVAFWLFGAAHAFHVLIALMALLDGLSRDRR